MRNWVQEGPHEAQGTQCGKECTKQGGGALSPLWQETLPKAVRIPVLNSGSKRTTAEAQMRVRPVDVIVAHRNLPEHSSAERDKALPVSTKEICPWLHPVTLEDGA